jgi:hypothetical protein
MTDLPLDTMVEKVPKKVTLFAGSNPRSPYRYTSNMAT